MPRNAWSPKRERQYEHIKENLEERGTGEDKAQEIAARTVNKDRARAGGEICVARSERLCACPQDSAAQLEPPRNPDSRLRGSS